MPNKNDLTAIKLKNKNALQKADLNIASLSKVKVGRKPKALEERESETVVLKPNISPSDFSHVINIRSPLTFIFNNVNFFSLFSLSEKKSNVSKKE